ASSSCCRSRLKRLPPHSRHLSSIRIREHYARARNWFIDAPVLTASRFGGAAHRAVEAALLGLSERCDFVPTARLHERAGRRGGEKHGQECRGDAGRRALVAMRGIEGRSSGRRIFFSIDDSSMSIARLSDRDLAEYSDLQLAALAWLSMQKMMLDAASRLGPERVGSIVTGQLMENMRETLAAAARHFRLDLDVDARLADGMLERHSKTGEPFSPKRRAERVAEGMRAHGAEIEAVVEWARKVAEKTG